MSAVLEACEPSARYLDTSLSQVRLHLDLLAGAPQGRRRLRQLILTLAVRGRLVAQDFRDEHAIQLLTRVQAAKQGLVASGRIARGSTLAPVVDVDETFTLPPGWAWCRLGDLAWPQAGFAFKSSEFNEIGQGVPLIRIRDVGATSAPSTFFAGVFREEFVVSSGDWLISMDGEFRVCRWHSKSALLNQRVTRLVFASNELSTDFVAAALQLQLTDLQGTKAYTTVDHLSGKQIAEAVIALPPAREQARIVARVDELMRLCDALEEKGRLEAEQHARLLSTLLGTLTDSATPEELAANWQRVAEHFDLLLDRPEAVDQVDSTILRLAVAGRLVPQTSSDGSDSIVPAGWSRTTIGAVATLVTDGTHKTPRYVENGVKFVSAKDVRDGRLSFTACRYITPEEHRELTRRCRPERGDILVSKSGSIGTVVRVETDEEFSLFESLALIKFDHRQVVGEFFELATQDACNALSDEQVKGVAVKHLHLNVLRKIPVLLPPLEEQHRIVARVTELRRLCADLRQRLSASQTTQSSLADALVESALT